MKFSLRLRPALALVCLALLGGGIQHAHAAIINLDAGPENWLTASGFTVQSVTDPEILVSPAMQVCGSGSCNWDSGVFVKNFALKPDRAVLGKFDAIGDDLMIFSTNGIFRFAAVLDENLAGPGDKTPIPLRFLVNQYDLELLSGTLVSQGTLTGAFGQGANQVRIDFYDGHFEASKPEGVLCSETISIPGTETSWCVTDRVNEYVHIKGRILVVPEPGILALLGISLAGFAGARRRQQ